MPVETVKDLNIAWDVDHPVTGYKALVGKTKLGTICAAESAYNLKVCSTSCALPEVLFVHPKGELWFPGSAYSWVQDAIARQPHDSYVVIGTARGANRVKFEQSPLNGLWYRTSWVDHRKGVREALKLSGGEKDCDPLAPPEPHPCSCNLRELMAFGCKCGGV